jgi:hypothetical protein
MANVNLIPKDQGAKPSLQRYTSRGLIVAVLVVAAAIGGLFIYNRILVVRENNFKSQTAQVLREQEQYAAVSEEAMTLQVQLSSLQKLLNDHVYWSELLWHLEEKSLKNGRIDSLQGNRSGTINITASIPSYTDLSKQIVAYLSDPFFESYSLTSASLSSDEDGSTRINYNLTLVLAKNALKKTDAQVLEDSTRVIEAVPASEIVPEGEAAATEENAGNEATPVPTPTVTPTPIPTPAAE